MIEIKEEHSEVKADSKNVKVDKLTSFKNNVKEDLVAARKQVFNEYQARASNPSDTMDNSDAMKTSHNQETVTQNVQKDAANQTESVDTNHHLGNVTGNIEG